MRSRVAFGRNPWLGSKQGETRRKKLSADNLSGESARQVEAAGTAGQRELAEGFDLGEIERKAVRMAETAQDASLQGEGLRLQKLQFDAARVGLRAEDGGDQMIRGMHLRRRRFRRFRRAPGADADCSRARVRAAGRRAPGCGESVDRGWRRRDEMAGRGSGETPRPADG